MNRLATSIRDDIIGAAFLLVTIVRPFWQGKQNPGWEAFEDSAAVLGLIMLYVVIRAVAEVWSEIEKSAGKFTEVVSPIAAPDGTHPTSFVKDRQPPHFKPILVAIPCVLSLFVFMGLFAIHTIVVNQTRSNTLRVEPPLVEVPTVEVHYEPTALPLQVVPKMKVYVLKMNSELSQLVSEQVIDNTNGTKNVVFPPFKMPVRTISAISVYACTVKNHSSNDLVDVRLKFHISKRKVIKVRDVWSQNKKTNSVSATMVGRTALHWAVFDRGHTTEYVDGDEYGAFDRTIVVPSIGAHDVAFVYLVNTCSCPVRFDLPNQGTAIVSGQNTSQTLRFIRPPVNFLDVIPEWGLVPTDLPWNLPRCD